MSIPEVEVRASTGAGALNEDAPEIIASWDLPKRLLEQELRVREADVRLMSIRGDSMLPTLSDGDRILWTSFTKPPHLPVSTCCGTGRGWSQSGCDVGDRTGASEPTENNLQYHLVTSY